MPENPYVYKECSQRTYQLIYRFHIFMVSIRDKLMNELKELKSNKMGERTLQKQTASINRQRKRDSERKREREINENDLHVGFH